MNIESISAVAAATLPIPAASAQADSNGGGNIASPAPRPSVKADDNTAADNAAIEESVHALNRTLQSHNISLKFSRDEATKTIVIEMIDETSGEKLQQFPNETMLHLAATLGELRGQIFSRQA